MATSGGPDIITDGLVFGYDTGYGIADNNTATRFYKGEPTVNLFSSPQFTSHSNTTVGTTSILKEDFGENLAGIEMIQLGTSDIASFAMGSIATIPSGGTYTWSSYVYATSVGSKVKGQVTVYVNGVRHWLTNSNAWVTSTVECNHLFKPTIANQWHKVDNQFTLPTGTLTNLSLGGWYRAASNFTIKIANCHLELNSHVTPFTLVSRTNTDSLIDLKKSTSIDLSNVSFDTTGQPVFDGTDDNITLTSNPHYGLNNATWEFIVKFNVVHNSETSTYRQLYIQEASIWIAQYYNKIGLDIRKDNNAWFDGNGGLVTGSQIGPVDSGKYYHVVMTWDGANAKGYLNGEIGFTTAISGLTSIKNGLSPRRIGQRSSTPLDGHMPVVKMHNQALTAEEVKQNYNAYKNRFNL